MVQSGTVPSMNLIILQSLSESKIVDFPLVYDGLEARLVGLATTLASSGPQKALNCLV